MDLSPGLKRPGLAVDHSPPTSAIIACAMTALPG